MKYLYKILRLLFCPHKYIEVEVMKLYSDSSIDPDKRPYGVSFVSKCVYCGRFERFTVKA